MEKQPEFIPVSRDVGQVERPEQPNTPPKTDSGAERAVREQVKGSSGLP